MLQMTEIERERQAVKAGRMDRKAIEHSEALALSHAEALRRQSVLALAWSRGNVN